MREKTNFYKNEPPYYYTPYEEEEIDLKELILTILKYKKFLIFFTIFSLLLATFYIYTTKPIYKIEANIKPGYIINIKTDNVEEISLLDTNIISTFIENTFDQSKAPQGYPKIIAKKSKNKIDKIVNIQIEDFSNKKALEVLHKILNSLKSQEDIKIKTFKKNILSQIDVIKRQITTLKEQYSSLLKNIPNINSPEVALVITNSINNIKNKMLGLNLKLKALEIKILPQNIKYSSIIGKPIINDYPIKPKKKLILIVSFITSLILGIFLIFFFEFLKGLKEKEKATK